MNSQDLRYLQEAYMEVVINEGKKSFPFDKVSNKIKSKQEKQQQLEKDVESGFISKKRAIPLSSKLGNQRVKMGMTYAKERMKKKEEDNLKRSPTFYRKDKHLSKMTKTQREEIDLYDIILSHLLDEGYAETPEAAETIMVHMSEDWREGIVEELTGQRRERAAAIAAKKTRTDSAGDKKRRQARWLSGRDQFSSIGKKGHPSEKFGSHPEPGKTRAPKYSIANNKRGPGVKKMKPSSRNIWVDTSRPDNVPGHGMPQVDTLPRGKGSKAARRVAALKKENQKET